MIAREYRIRWQRKGKPGRREIRQTEAGAETFAQRLIELELDDIENADEDYDHMGNPFGASPVPPLIRGPVIDSRPVGAWSNPGVWA